MRIVMLTNNTVPDKLGGLERYVTELARELVKLGEQVTVVAKARERTAVGDRIGEDGVRVIRYAMPEKSDPLFAVKYPLAVRRGVREALTRVGGHDVLHAHFPVPALVPALNGTPFVYTLHAPVWRELLVERQDSYTLPPVLQRSARGALRAAERRVVRRARRVLTLSDFMRSEVGLLDDAVGGRVRVIPGGIDTTTFTPAPGSKSADPAAPVLFTARRLTPRTGVAQLVQAMPHVLEQFPRAHLNVAGDGYQRKAVDQEIERLGLQGSVTMLGRISEADLIAWYQRADLAVTPTQELEGFGLSTAEAFACGTPCVVTPAGANPEVAEAVDPSLVSADISPLSMATAIVDWLGRSQDRDEVSRRCRARVEPAMSWPEIAQGHRALYRDLAS